MTLEDLIDTTILEETFWVNETKDLFLTFLSSPKIKWVAMQASYYIGTKEHIWSRILFTNPPNPTPIESDLDDLAQDFRLTKGYLPNTELVKIDLPTYLALKHGTP